MIRGSMEKMKDGKYSLPTAQITQLNNRIAGLYRAAHENSLLESVVSTISELIPGDIHLAFFTNRNDRVSYATSAGSDGDEFIMATMSVAESHPLIYQTDREVNAISDVLSNREWQRRDMYHYASPYVKMTDALGMDMRISADMSFSTCVIRDKRNFQNHERLYIQLLIPHFINLLGMYGSSFSENDRFHILPIESLSGPSRVSHRVLWDVLELSPGGAGHLLDWIRHHRMTNSSGPQSFFLRSTTSIVHAVLIPRSSQCEGTVAIRNRPLAGAILSTHSLLTRRESEVGHWLCAGKTNAEIAMILEISAGTVKRHLENIYEKLGVPNRISAATMIRDAKEGWRRERDSNPR